MSAAPAGAVMDLPRRDARDKLAGRTRYTIDRGLPGMLHAAILRAPVAAGRLVRIDTRRARLLPGVRAIATAADAPGRFGIGIADHPLFALDLVRFKGEPLAAVAAESEAIARASLAAIEVTIEPLPPLLTTAEALAPGAREIHPDWRTYEVLGGSGARGGNIAWEATVVRGDVEAAFARSDVTIVESEFRTGRQNHVCFEPRVVLARFEDGRYHIETSTQVPWTVRAATARLLGVSPPRCVSPSRRSAVGLV